MIRRQIFEHDRVIYTGKSFAEAVSELEKAADAEDPDDPNAWAFVLTVDGDTIASTSNVCSRHRP